MKPFRSTLMAASAVTFMLAGTSAIVAPAAFAADPESLSTGIQAGDIQTIVALQDRGDDRRGGRGARGGGPGGDDGARGPGRGGRGGDGPPAGRGGPRGDGPPGGGRGGGTRPDGPRQPDVRIPDERRGSEFRGRPGGNDGFRGGNRGGNDGFRGGNRGGNDGFRGGNRGGNDGFRDRNRGGHPGFDNRSPRPDPRFGNRGGNPRFDNRNPRYDPRWGRRDQRRDPRIGPRHGGPRYDVRVQHHGRYVPPQRYRAYHGSYRRPARASWRYHAYYYDRGYDRYDWRYYDRVCRSSGDTVIAGALLGALFGAAVADDSGSGALFGGFLGASVGYGLNDCDRGQYRYAVHYAFSNNSPYYWHNPHSGVRGVVYARDYYNYGNRRCRYGDAEIYMPDGSVEYDQVRMCQDAYGRWQVANYQ